MSFKGYLSRFMAKSAILQPSINNAVSKYLIASAEAISDSCTGGNTSHACGQKWYTNGYDGVSGIGQQMSALETVQGLLLLGGSAARTIPRTQANVQIEVVPSRSEFPLTPPKETSASSSDPGSDLSGSGSRGSSAAISANIMNRQSLKLWLAMMLLLIATAFGSSFRLLK